MRGHFERRQGASRVAARFIDQAGARPWIELDLLAAETAFYAGCDLEELIIRAKQNFFNDTGARAMNGRHLLAAHKDYRINVETRSEIETTYQNLGGAFASSVDLLRSLGTRTPKAS